MLIQVLLLLFVLFALLRSILQFKQGRLSRKWFAFWFVFWVIVGTVVLLPWTAQTVAKFVGVGRGADLVIYVSLIALFYLVFRLFIKIEDVEREITMLVRKQSLEEVEPNEKDS